MGGGTNATPNIDALAAGVPLPAAVAQVPDAALARCARLTGWWPRRLGLRDAASSCAVRATLAEAFRSRATRPPPS
jgi:hypothetical protein